MYVYLYNIGDEAGEAAGERLAALLPGIRALTGQIDFILAGTTTGAIAAGNAAGEFFRCNLFKSFLKPLDGEDAKAAVKEINRLIGKEKLLAAVGGGLWKSTVALLCGQAAPEGPVLAELYIKGFPGPGAAELKRVLAADELARA